ncbi:MAG: anaerobic ribonucleoside-triphosphate reductase [Synergistales bacterium]|nr:anaerobic ribonucleoside-triphosphate reductase [Synergistales bacterium]
MEQRKKGNRTRCEVYSRVVGFLSPVSQWNRGKAAEFADRKTFDVQGLASEGDSVDNRQD